MNQQYIKSKAHGDQAESIPGLPKAMKQQNHTRMKENLQEPHRAHDTASPRPRPQERGPLCPEHKPEIAHSRMIHNNPESPEGYTTSTGINKAWRLHSTVGRDRRGLPRWDHSGQRRTRRGASGNVFARRGHMGVSTS